MRSSCHQESANVKVDQAVTLQAVALDDEGEPIEALEFVWTSSDPAIAAMEAGVTTGKGSRQRGDHGERRRCHQQWRAGHGHGRATGGVRARGFA